MIKYQDEESQLRDIKLGQIDAINSGGVELGDRARREPNVKLWASPSPGFNELAFNSCPPQGSPICTGPGPGVNVKVVQDPAIRHALQYAINRTEIDTVVWHDLPGPSPGRPDLADLQGEGLLHRTGRRIRSSATTTTPRRPSRCSPRAAGSARRTAGRAPRTAPRRSSRSTCSSSSSEDQQTALRIKAWAAAVGIKINLSVKTEDAVNAEIYATTSSKNAGGQGQVRALLRRLHVGLGRRHCHARLQLRRA